LRGVRNPIRKPGIFWRRKSVRLVYSGIPLMIGWMIISSCTGILSTLREKPLQRLRML